MLDSKAKKSKLAKAIQEMRQQKLDRKKEIKGIRTILDQITIIDAEDLNSRTI